MELPEDGRDGASQGLGLRARIEPGQPLGDQGQELPGDLPGSPSHGEEGRHFAVQPGTECRNGIPGRLALVLGDGRDPHLAG